MPEEPPERRHADFRIRNIEETLNKAITRLTNLEALVARLKKWYKVVDSFKGFGKEVTSTFIRIVKVISVVSAALIPIVAAILGIAALSEDVSITEVFKLIKALVSHDPSS